MLSSFESESEFEQCEDTRLDQLPLRILQHLLSVLRKLDQGELLKS